MVASKFHKEIVDLFGGCAFMHHRGNFIQRHGRQLASLAHASKIFWRMQLDAWGCFSLGHSAILSGLLRGVNAHAITRRRGLKMTEAPTAAVLLIGNEVLTGRTKDKNLGFIADYLAALGIDLLEARVVADDEADIVAAVNALRARYTYVFSTGGIGPTHDDVTADCMAKAFGVGISHHPQAVEILTTYFKEIGREANEARMRMARIPDGATLILNSVSKAPGFRIGNVFVMAGVPKVMHAMMDSLAPQLVKGDVAQSRSIEFQGGEGDVAKPLKEIQDRYAAVTIGSYPFESPQGYATNLVLRSRDVVALETATDDVKAMATQLVREGKARGWS
jgi:molybdenum cofactor synthesis domain-containing protein